MACGFVEYVSAHERSDVIPVYWNMNVDANCVPDDSLLHGA